MSHNTGKKSKILRGPFNLVHPLEQASFEDIQTVREKLKI